MPKIQLDRAPLGARRNSIPPPLIPLQQPADPLIPLQMPSHAKLQHELSHKTLDSPAQTLTFFAAPTELPSIQLRRRQNVVTTVTDADIVVIDNSGHTIATTVISGIQTGSLTITLPFTTVTIPPLQSISSIYPLTTANNVPTVLPVTNSPEPTPQSSAFGFIPGQSSLSLQIPNSSAQQVLTSPLPTPGFPAPAAATGTSNNQLGLPNSASSTAISSSILASLNSTSTAAASSSTITSSTFATSISSGSSSSSSSSSQLSSTSSTVRSTSSQSSSSAIGSGNGGLLPAPTATGNTPAATSTTALSDANGSSVNVPVVGGVVGGLAGLALLLVVVLLGLRWWRRRDAKAMTLRSIDDETFPPGTSSSNAPMTQNSTAPGVAAGAVGAAGLGAMFKRMTAGSTATTETSPSEKGFQNFGGRKLESVLVSGGDGYGEPSRSGTHTPTSLSRGWAERFPYDTPSKHSSMVVGPSTPYRRQSNSISGMAELSGSSVGRPDSDTLKMMPGPARSATYTGPGDPGSHSSTRLSPPRGNLLETIGQGRYSQEGGRGSRSKFTEEI